MDIVQQWLDALPPDKKMRVLTRSNPLYTAVLFSHLDVAELLLEHGMGKLPFFFLVRISLVPGQHPHAA